MNQSDGWDGRAEECTAELILSIFRKAITTFPGIAYITLSIARLGEQTFTDADLIWIICTKSARLMCAKVVKKILNLSHSIAFPSFLRVELFDICADWLFSHAFDFAQNPNSSLPSPRNRK